MPCAKLGVPTPPKKLYVYALLAPLAIPIAIIAGIALVIYSLKQAFDDFKFELEATGSVWEAVKSFIVTAITNLFFFPFELLKKGISWIVGKIGDIFGIESFKNLETMLDDVDIVEGFRKGLVWVGNFISGLWDNFKLWILDKVGNIPIVGTMVKALLGTKEEIQAGIAEKKKVQAEYVKQREILKL